MRLEFSLSIYKFTTRNEPQFLSEPNSEPRTLQLKTSVQKSTERGIIQKFSIKYNSFTTAED